MKTVRFEGKKWELPEVAAFEPYGSGGLCEGYYFYEVVGYRPPKKGEYYLSGAIVEAYCAPNDLSTPYLVVVKTKRVVLRQVWVPA